MRSLALVWLVAVVLAFAGCEDPKAKDVRAADDRVNQAIDSGNGAQAVKLITRASADRLTRLVNAARTMPRAALRTLPLTERVEVLEIRARLTAPELKGLDGPAYYTLIVNKGLLRSTAAEGMRTGKIKVNGDAATVEFWGDADKPDMGFYAFEDGEWKEDHVAFAQWQEKVLAAALRDSGMDADAFVEEVVGEDIDGPMPEDLWQPRK